MTFYKFAVFPVDEPTNSFMTEVNAKFGSRRDDGRIHAGCDLYVEDGAAVRAVADGVVLSHLIEFYGDAKYISVDHGNFICRYGELQGYGERPISLGWVKAGDIVGYVKKTLRANKTSYNRPMLHLELYSKLATGKLTNRDNKPTQRRADLVDPTLSLSDSLDRYKTNIQLLLEQKELALRGKKNPLDLLINR